MRFNLQIAYLSLLSVTCISSLLLFFVVFTQNAKYVAAYSDEASVLSTANTDADANSAAGDKTAVPHTTAATTPTNLVDDDKVFTNNNEVKDFINNEGETFVAAAEAASVNKLDSVVSVKEGITAEEAVKQSADGWLLPSDVEAVKPINVKINNAAINDEVHEQLEEPKDNAAADGLHSQRGDGFQNNDAEVEVQQSLPDITEIPTITVTELPFEILEPTRANIDALVIDAAKEAIVREHENHTMEMLENSSEVIRKEEEIIKFDDSGGGEQPPLQPPTMQMDAEATLSEIPQNIPNVNVTSATTTTLPTQNESISPTGAAAAANTINTGTPAKVSSSSTTTTTIADDISSTKSTVNLTVEEVPIPVFSEWAQKQMEAAEKQQAAKDQEVVNTATQKKNHTNGDGKRAAPLKMRNKNYASPDCGAKIIASNPDTSNTGAVLSSSKDEYMLSPCGNRIWFVVELCEAIQAQKVELANFELYSSSPKNFTVAVSNRFPTRDWSNVGRFIAEDKRNVQSFDLHPHLFGKFVRVDIHSHYSKEHFCPVSLFRVFGTSEFEAFETEDTPHIDIDDFGDDDFGQEQLPVKSADTNLFKSASDAVLSIVKKAAEVLAKPANQLNATFTRIQTPSSQCRTPAAGQYSCTDCNQPMVAQINTVLSCEYQQLQALLKIPWLLKDLLSTQICAKDYGIEVQQKTKIVSESCQQPSKVQSQPKAMDVKNRYYLNMLPKEYVGALCQLLATQYVVKSTITATHPTHDTNIGDGETITEPPLNLTIDKKLKKDDLRIIDGKQQQKKLITPESTQIGIKATATESAELSSGSGDDATLPPPPQPSATMPSTTTESGTIEVREQLARPPHADTLQIIEITTNAPEAHGEGEQQLPVAPDVNIFNVPTHLTQQEEQEQQQQTSQQPIDPTLLGNQRACVESSGECAGSDDSAGSISTTTTTSMPTASADGQRIPSTDGGLNIDDVLTPTPPPPASLGSRSEEDTASWENIDNLITSTTATSGGVDSAAVQANQPGVNLQQKIPSGPQSESVFIRLSNRIKALERNMSLSGQYLEELSRRYKKQVEELQLTLTQTVQTVRLLEEQSRRQSELHQLLAQRNTQLKDELDDLSLQVHACIVVIIFVGAFIFLVLMVSILFYRSMRRETKEVLALYTNANKKKTASAVAAMQRKLNRRKSFEDFSDHQQSNEKIRRPSEEALMILKERSSNNGNDNNNFEAVGDAAKNTVSQRERKISICYSTNNNNTSSGSGAMQNLRQRRKGEKHSWPNTEHAQQQARRHLEQLQKAGANGTGMEFVQNLEKVNGRPPRVPQVNGGGENKSNGNKSRRKSQVVPRRQNSVPHDFVDGGGGVGGGGNTAPSDISATEYDESLRLEEDDLDNFIPTSDLAYNEFMPEGPSGYQVDDCVDACVENSKKSGSKKLSRLSAPGFFKSPFGKNRNKLRNSKSAKHPHESTSWEWYRSKNNAESKALQLSSSASASGGFMRRQSPTGSLDASSLSEILLPNSRTENSFRMLEEAILSSGESIAASSVTTNGTSATDNGNGNGNGSTNGNSNANTYSNGSHSNGSSLASNSNRSSTSSTSTKKKNRSFNKIFRKVF